MLGFLFAVFTVSGYDSAAHMSEETFKADRRAARSMYVSFLVNWTLGLGLLLAILFSLQVNRLQEWSAPSHTLLWRTRSPRTLA